MIDLRNALCLLIAALLACVVPSHDQEGLACDSAHACTGGRVCSSGVCLDPDHVVVPPPPPGCTASCVDMLCGDLDSCGNAACVAGGGCTQGDSIDRMDDTSASWIVIADSTSTMTATTVATPHIAGNSLQLDFQIGGTDDSFAFAQRAFDAAIDMTSDSGLLIWVYADNTGYPIRVQLIDSDGVRFELTTDTDWQGWHALHLPFASMTRSDYQDPGVTATQTTPRLDAVRGMTFAPAYLSGVRGTVRLDLLSRIRP